MFTCLKKKKIPKIISYNLVFLKSSLIFKIFLKNLFVQVLLLIRFSFSLTLLFKNI